MVIPSQLKTIGLIIIFLLLLILDVPEFITCIHTVPDEILDVPCVLVRGNISGNETNAEKLLKTIGGMLGSSSRPPQKRKPNSFRSLSAIDYAAEIKRQYLYSQDIRQYEDSESAGYLVRQMQRPIIPVEKSNQMLSILRISIPSILRI